MHPTPYFTRAASIAFDVFSFPLLHIFPMPVPYNLSHLFFCFFIDTLLYAIVFVLLFRFVIHWVTLRCASGVQQGGH